MMKAVLDSDAPGELVGNASIMGQVVACREIRPGDEIRVELPAPQHRRLAARVSECRSTTVR
jgi:hypothetical protein